jgi:hypothetical protein
MRPSNVYAGILSVSNYLRHTPGLALSRKRDQRKNLTRFYFPKVSLRPRNANAWLLRMAGCLLFPIYEAVVAKEEETLHPHSRIVIMDACKLSSRRRVASPACAVLPTPGTVG